MRSAVVPTTREVPTADVIAPAPVRSAVVPQTRIPEPPTPEVPADFPATRPPAAMPTAAIPTTLPPTSPTAPMAPDPDRTLVDAPEGTAASEASAEATDATSRVDDPRLRTLPGFGDPERVPRANEPGSSTDPGSSTSSGSSTATRSSNDPEDPS